MRILINASNLKVGGGIQVADSIIRELYRYPQHYFCVICSSALMQSIDDIQRENIKFIQYDMVTSLSGMLLGRNRFLDSIIEQDKIDAVLTFFGPARWRPKVRHLSGFAISHLLLPESPYWLIKEVKRNWKQKIKIAFLRFQFAKDADEYFTENPFISERLHQLYPQKQIYTISNTYNQVFDEPQRWQNDIQLEQANTFKLLTIASYYPHKNINIIPSVVDILQTKYPTLNFQFVLSVDSERFWEQNTYTEQRAKAIVFLGKVPIQQCPSLYQQTNAMFLPTLLECFSASYAEAMRMERPILTSNLGFASSICKDAALYFNPTDAEDIADKIYQLAVNKELQQQLVEAGKKQLITFNSAEQRARKLLDILSQ